jgi:hypothetical protein
VRASEAPSASSGVTIEEIAQLVGHGSTSVTECVYRKELRPVITRGARAINELRWRRQAIGRTGQPIQAPDRPHGRKWVTELGLSSWASNTWTTASWSTVPRAEWPYPGSSPASGAKEGAPAGRVGDGYAHRSPAGGGERRGARLWSLYLTSRSLDPTGTGGARWVTRWKPAVNAFAITPSKAASRR